MGSKLGVHVYQFAGAPEIVDFIQRARPRVLKTVDLDETVLKICRNASPDTLIIGRLWCESQEYRTDPGKEAREFCQRRLLPVAEQLRGLIDAWEGYNEGGWQGPEDLAAYAVFEAERTWLLAEEGFRSVVGNFAPGKPALEDWEHFVPALRAAKVAGGFLGLHEWSGPALTSLTAWDPDHPDKEGEDEGWLTLRYRKVYRRVLPADLRDLPLIITECGIDGKLNPYASYGPGGWQHLAADEYLQQLAWYDGELQRDPYVVGACVSTLGGGSLAWDNYDIKGEMSAKLADYIAAHPPEPWAGGPAPLSEDQQLLATLAAEFGEQFADYREMLPKKSEYTRRPLEAIRYLVIHHTGPGTTPQTHSSTLARSQMEARGWPAINYHFLVYPNQVRYVGPLDTSRPHVHGYNDQAVGIALVGDFDQGPPSTSTVALTARLCRVLERKLGRKLARRGHRDLTLAGETTCPGNTAYGTGGWLTQLEEKADIQRERIRKKARLQRMTFDIVELFYSYAHEDEQLRDELSKHLSILQRQGILSAWHDREITAGSEWKGEIDAHLESAQVILLLISADFLASDYCYDVEMKRALERHERNEAIVIPIILRPVSWSGAPFAKLQALPKDAKPVTTWSNRDAAFLSITEGIRDAVSRLASRSKLVGE